ncbi:hypothetical protein MJO28_008619 [Puccinia striiformis f. sp. tritici]|uniref:Uncharacterized protein n=1 Tax=Puccinia striiformis f. sp. tritici TaxID=168172 RepID=A0ACC0EBK0_9BASI|nr:hypothetical protein MJO28_008619 [Puccinia striiformis f. sp. tritici]
MQKFTNTITLKLIRHRDSNKHHLFLHLISSVQVKAIPFKPLKLQENYNNNKKTSNRSHAELELSE